MARTPKPPTTPKSESVVVPFAQPSQALVPWQEQMEKDAQIAAAMEQNTGGGTYFSLKAGVLSFGGNALPNNQMAVVVLDSLFENTFYAAAYNADTLTPPTCYALGAVDTELVPHPDVVALGQAQHERCLGCPMNAYGTATTGKGKACSNRRRLAVIACGDLTEQGAFKAFTDGAERMAKDPIGFLKLPPTSAVGWAGVVKSVAGTLRRPPYGVFMKVRVVPDAKSQFKVLFEPISTAPDRLMPVIINRVAEAKLSIGTPYDLTETETAPAPAAGRGRPSPAPKRPVVKRAGKKF